MPRTEPATRLSPEERERYLNPHVVPVLVLELSDERSRSRLREAALLSIIFHLLLIMLFPPLYKWETRKAVKVWTAQELINRNHELTYLKMPDDSQTLSQPPKTDIISDKNRIATSKHPTLDERTLKELRGSSLEPRPPGPPPQPASPPAQIQQQAQGAPPTPRPNPTPNQTAKLEPLPSTAPVPNAFGKPALSPGSAIEQAAREAAGRRAGTIGGGDYGGGIGGVGRGGGSVQGDLEILSDTMGVNFGPYLERVRHDIQSAWFPLIPESAWPPLLKKGKVAIEFAILKDGSVRGLKYDSTSGDVSLDRAAYGGITASNPFPPLPSDFAGQYLLLRCYFYYNPDSRDLQ